MLYLDNNQNKIYLLDIFYSETGCLKVFRICILHASNVIFQLSLVFIYKLHL